MQEGGRRAWADADSPSAQLRLQALPSTTCLQVREEIQGVSLCQKKQGLHICLPTMRCSMHVQTCINRRTTCIPCTCMRGRVDLLCAPPPAGQETVHDGHGQAPRMQACCGGRRTVPCMDPDGARSAMWVLALTSIIILAHAFHCNRAWGHTQAWDILAKEGVLHAHHAHMDLRCRGY